MSDRPVLFTAAARAELRRAVDRYDTIVPGLGDELASEVEHAVMELIAYPEVGTIYLGGTRRMLVRRFPFTVIYHVKQKQVVIVAVAHQRRRPGYWLRRL